jgi:putative ABC transport system substrate-binding protein
MSADAVAVGTICGTIKGKGKDWQREKPGRATGCVSGRQRQHTSGDPYRNWPGVQPSDADIQSAFTARARDGSGAIIGIADTFVADHCDLIIALAAQHRLPAIYGNPIFARSGGLMVYSPDYADIYRRAADYVDRILRGARPAELPVQEPDKFTLSVNLKAARAISLNLPQTLIARADEVIE